MDEFLSILNEVAVVLLPILGAVVLFFLAVILYRILKLLKVLQGSMTTVDHTLTTVDDYVTQLEAPVKTVVKISKGVDVVQNTTENAIKQVIQFVMENFEWIKETIVQKFKKTNQEGGTSDE
jgi:hypothetical protein